MQCLQKGPNVHGNLELIAKNCENNNVEPTSLSHSQMDYGRMNLYLWTGDVID